MHIENGSTNYTLNNVAAKEAVKITREVESEVALEELMMLKVPHLMDFKHSKVLDVPLELEEIMLTLHKLLDLRMEACLPLVVNALIKPKLLLNKNLTLALSKPSLVKDAVSVATEIIYL